MSGLTGALDIARWSMYASQLALEVTSHNIANANTQGYSKQNLQLQANNPITMTPGQLGTGVRATEVTRRYDIFLNEQVNKKTSDSAYWDAQKSVMDGVQGIFNESSGDGVNALMSAFWNAWGDLANNPDGMPERNSLLANTDNLVSMIHNMDANLRSYQQNLNVRIKGSVDDVNKIIKQIAGLNNSISSVEVKGMINANDLRDQRDLLLSQLSGHLDISYYEDEDTGQVNVFILGGTPLVLGIDANSLSTARDTATGFSRVLWNDTSGRSVDITDKLHGGDIAGSVNVRDNQINSYLDSLNTLTKELLWQVNALHSEGTGLKSVQGLTGTVQCSGLGDDISSDFLFSDRYNSGGAFDIVVYDSSGTAVNTYTINPASGDTVGDLIDDINTKAAAGGGEIIASLTGGTSGNFQIQANAGFTFAVKPDASTASSNALAILGANTFFSWDEQVGQPISDLTQTVGINEILSTDPGNISSGYLDSNNNVAPGANDVARAIAALQDKVITDIGGPGVSATLDTYYSSLVGQVGVDAQNADQNKLFNETLLGQYTQQKESVTGVSLDEEMTDLLKNQYLYQTSAKLVSICDEMMQSLLSIK